MDGIEYNLIKQIPSKAAGGNSQVGLVYEAIDENPQPDELYYRLAQQDHDGTTSTSAPLAIKSGTGKKELLVNLFPNPCKGVLTLEVDGLKRTVRIKISIKNTTGQVVWDEVFYATDTYLQKTIDLSSTLPAGIYQFTLSHADKIKNRKFVKLD